MTHRKILLCLLPEQRWRLDALEQALQPWGLDLQVHHCHAHTGASQLHRAAPPRCLQAVLYSDALDVADDWGQTDTVAEFLQAAAGAGAAVVREHFAFGGPLGDELVPTTPVPALLAALLDGATPAAGGGGWHAAQPEPAPAAPRRPTR